MTQDEQIRFVARVIFAEAAADCPFADRQIVALTIKNRCLHPGFAASDPYAAASQQGAYSCIDDSNNKNWAATENAAPICAAWSEALFLATGLYKKRTWPGKELSGSILKSLPVYYHNKSIAMPSSWSNKWYTAVKLGETDRFVYYSAIPTEG